MLRDNEGRGLQTGRVLLCECHADSDNSGAQGEDEADEADQHVHRGRTQEGERHCGRAKTVVQVQAKDLTGNLSTKYVTRDEGLAQEMQAGKNMRKTKKYKELLI